MTFAARVVVSVACVIAVIATARAADGDPARGKTVFARCVACHDLNTGTTVLGPTLKDIVGRPSGAIAGYAYSPAMKASAITWTPTNLAAFIASPTRTIPGSRMAFAGLPDAGDRADLIAYLQQAAH